MGAEAFLDGFAVIAAAFLILVQESFRRARPASAAAEPLAYGIGAAEALAYAVAHFGRKAGLGHLDAPALDTFASALSGCAAFALLAFLSERCRGMFRDVFRNIDRLVSLAAILVSAGQVLMFAALAFAPVSTVVMISSLEIFFSIFLSWLVFRTGARPGPQVLASAGIAILGILLIASG